MTENNHLIDRLARDTEYVSLYHLTMHMKTARKNSRKKHVSTLIVGCFATAYTICAASPLAYAANNDRFSPALTDSVQSIQTQTDMSFNGTQGGAQGVTDAIIDIVKKIITPVILISGVLVAFLGMYEMFTSDKEEATKKGMNYIIR